MSAEDMHRLIASLRRKHPAGEGQAAEEERPGTPSPRIEELCEALEDGSLEERTDAASEFGRLKDPDAVPALLRAMLRDREDIDIAGTALVEIGRSSTEPICAVLDGGTVPARSWVGERGDEGLRAGSGRVLSLGVRQALMRVLVQLADPDSIPTLGRLLHDENRPLRKSAATLLGQFQAPEARKLLFEACRNNDLGTKVAAAEALAETGDAEAIPHLCSQLKHRKAEVRHAFGWALVRITAPDDQQLCSTLMQMHETDIIPLADPRAVAHLCLALEHGTTEVRRRSLLWIEHLAHNCPTPDLKAAREILRRRRLTLRTELPEDLELQNRLLTTLDEVLEWVPDLPVPSDAPQIQGEDLPIAAGPASTQHEHLPLPAREADRRDSG